MTLMSDYVTIEAVQELGYKLSDQDVQVLGKLVTRLSRLFDRACGFSADYFAAADADGSATSRDFWGNGTNYLKLDPYLTGSITTVTMPTGFTVPTYTEKRNNDGDFFLIRTYGDNGSRYSAADRGAHFDLFTAEFFGVDHIGWRDGIKHTVTAKWGWDVTPPEVVEAVAEWVIATLNSRDQKFARAVALDGGPVLTSAMPERTKLVADFYRNRRINFA